MDILVVIPIVALVVYGIIKNYSASATLAIAGMVLLIAAAFMGVSDILPEAKATGFLPFDLFELMNGVFSFRMASLGLTIMACGGFATYMSHIGASESLVKLAVKPISRFPFPLCCSGSLLSVECCTADVCNLSNRAGFATDGNAIPGTAYGLSAGSAVAVIASPAAFEIGVTQVNANFAASQSGMGITEYFLGYQAWVTVPMALLAAALHFYWQRRCDLKAGYIASEHVGEGIEKSEDGKNKPVAPVFYALLPMIPFFLLLTFSKMMVTSIKMNLVMAMLISVFAGMFCELLRTRNIKESLAGFDKFLNGMGAVFGPVVGLIIGAEVFATGLKHIGAIDSLLGSAQGLGINAGVMAVFMAVLIAISAIMMGSGNAAFLSFATLAPDVAKSFWRTCGDHVTADEFCSFHGTLHVSYCCCCYCLCWYCQNFPF